VKAGAGASGRRREVGSPDSKAASVCRAFATATGGGEGAVGDKSIRRIWRKTASRNITGSGSRRLPRTRCKGRPGGGVQHRAKRRAGQLLTEMKQSGERQNQGTTARHRMARHLKPRFPILVLPEINPQSGSNSRWMPGRGTSPRGVPSGLVSEWEFGALSNCGPVTQRSSPCAFE
jgi:hypothetical protein